MAQRLTIREIVPDTEDWACKVQVVDRYGGEGFHSKKKYLNIILQDEQEDQVKAILYDDCIVSYENVFKMYHTYVVTGATLSAPYLRNERPCHTFDWKILHGAIVDPIPGKMFPNEQPLPLPTRLNIIPLQEIGELPSDSKAAVVDVFAIVANCMPPRYVPKAKTELQEILLVDTNKQQMLLTIWEDHIIKNEGNTLLENLQQYPVVLARRLGITDFSGTSLVAKFNTTIQINPPYSHSADLRAWITDHKESLVSLTRRSTSDSGTLIFVPFDDEIVSVENIALQKYGHTFYIAAKMSLPQNLGGSTF